MDEGHLLQLFLCLFSSVQVNLVQFLLFHSIDFNCSLTINCFFNWFLQTPCDHIEGAQLKMSLCLLHSPLCPKRVSLPGSCTCLNLCFISPLPSHLRCPPLNPCLFLQQSCWLVPLPSWCIYSLSCSKLLLAVVTKSWSFLPAHIFNNFCFL